MVDDRGAYKSPHSVMSSTICWGVKKFVMLHVEAGHAADGVPHVDGSTEADVLLMSAGMLSLCITSENYQRKERKPVTKPQRTVQNQTL